MSFWRIGDWTSLMIDFRHILFYRLTLITFAALLLPAALYGDDPPLETITLSPEDVTPSIVLISYQVDGEAKCGNGVIVEMDGKPYLLTNQHILLGAEALRFMTASGDRLSPRSVELSATQDLARLALNEGSSLPLSDQTPMNMPIAIFTGGNGQEQMFHPGKIIGVGGSKIEISAEFDESSNGTPVLNEKTEVVGIATYSRESRRSAMKKGTRFDESTRHFCCRIGKGAWIPVNWKSYNQAYGKAYLEHKMFADQIIAIFNDSKKPLKSAGQARKLAAQCSLHARQIKVLTKKGDLTGFLMSEFEDQIELFEYAEELFSEYANGRS